MVSVLFHFQFEVGAFQQKYGNKLDILARKIIFHGFGLRQPKVRTSDSDFSLVKVRTSDSSIHP